MDKALLNGGRNVTSFYKYHGLGNDFVVVEQETENFEASRTRALCDRHRGVGADGVLVVSPGSGGDVAGKMTLYNRDGTRPEMCGNGIRCVARHLVEQMGKGEAGDGLIVETDAGRRKCRIVSREEPFWRVEVDMGDASVAESSLEFEAAGRTRRFVAADMGNPHAVTFEPAADEVVDAFGESLNSETVDAFPRGVNVEFVDVRGPAELGVVVFERGVGRTRACGTGACAAAAVSWERGEIEPGERTDVHLPGGVLQVRRSDDGNIWMTGPTVAVFEGTVFEGKWMST